MKKFARKKCRRCFLKPFFSHSRKLFQSFRTKFLLLLYMISLVYKISHCLFANHNLELRSVICTGVTIFEPVTLFALVLHLNCTALCQSESSNFFMCIIRFLTYSRHKAVPSSLGQSQREISQVEYFLRCVDCNN